MRKIKFRAKSKLTNEWLYSCMILQTGSPNVQFIARLDENHKIDLEIIKPETLGEFTGLQDINGKDIYEGDIIESVEDADHKFRYTVFFDNSAFRVKHQKFNEFGVFNVLYVVLKMTKCKVVGSIHDNPELLEADNERY